MSIENVVVPAIDEASFKTGLKAANALREGFDAQLTGLHIVELCPVDYVPALYWNATAIADYDASVRAEAEKLESVFYDFCRDHHIDHVAATAGGKRRSNSAAWEEYTGRMHDTLSWKTCKFDLALIGADPDEKSPFRASLIGDLIMETGTPVLLVPEGSMAKLPEKVLVAWNGGIEARRAVAFSEPILAQAKEVRIVSFDLEGAPVPMAEEMAQMLQRKGINAEGENKAQTDRSVATALKSEADRFDADLIVMGAYSHARWRQSVLGGLTQSIIEKPTRPVFLAN